MGNDMVVFLLSAVCGPLMLVGFELLHWMLG